MRGVPLDASGSFFEPLWTNFRFGFDVGILDWYTILVGLAAYFALTLHGATWLTLKADGAVAERARRFSRISWWAVALFTVVVTYASFRVQSHIRASFANRPWGFVFPALALAGLAGVWWWTSESRKLRGELPAFLSSCAYITGMLTSAAFGLFPLVLPARQPEYSLTIDNAKAGDYGLKIGFIWWVIGIALACGYFFFVYRSFAGKVSVSSEEKDGHANY